MEHLDPQSLHIHRKGVIAEDSPSFTRLFKPGQILFGKRRCYQKKAAVADFEGICSGDIIVMEAVPGKIIPELLPFIVQSDMFFEWAERTSSGSLSPRTKWKALAEFEFPLPPLGKKALDYDPKEIEGVVESVEAFKKLFPAAMQKCLDYFPGVDRTIEGYEGLIAAQDCLMGNEKKDAYASQFNVLKRFWEAISPDNYLNQYRRDYRWLAQVYESIKPVGGVGSLLWESLGPETIKIIHEHTDIDRIRDDIDELVMDAESVFELPEEERIKKAKKLNLSLMGKMRSKNDPRFEELGKRLERLKEKYEAGVLNSLEWLKELLDVARDMVHIENEAHEKVIPDDKQALTEIFLEVKSDATPQIVAGIVEDIDKIVKATRFDGWQNNHGGQREIQKVLRQTLFKYKLHKEQELFDKAYGYIREHY